MTAITVETHTPPLLLLVDDFTDNRELYAEYFSLCGYRVTQAATGVEAIDKAVHELPDLVVMDLGLPGMDGVEATRRLKSDSRTRHIPVIAVTGHSSGGDIEWDAYVVKPCLPDDLLDTVRRVLHATW